jgi:glyoxylase-like metal-dependent hydrolase (beta-lactamase superfamily II)
MATPRSHLPQPPQPVAEHAPSVAATPATSLSYPFPGPPAVGEALEVAPGVLWIRMPLPFALSHINLWAIADGDADGEGWTLVDSGVQSPETVEAWRSVLAGPCGGRPVKRVLVTHMHPDHVGMAGWLARKFQCRLWMTRLEYLTCRVLVADTGREAPDEAVTFYRRAGWDEDAIERYRTRFGGFGRNVHALPDSYRRVVDGESIRIGRHDWRIVVGNGHSPEHACLYSPALKVLVSGDQVLPRISSNVSVFPTEPDADPLGDWLASLAKLRAQVPDDVLVLPSHNEPFRGLHARLDALEAGHQRSLDRLRRLLAEGPCRAVDAFSALFARNIGADQMLLGLATGESIAHLNHLLARGEAASELGDDGVLRYRLA